MIAASEETLLMAAVAKSLWSEKMLSILLRRFLCSSLSPFNSFSPMTCPVRLFLGTGVPSSSAGDTTTILLLVLDASSSLLSPTFLDFSACSPGLPGEEEAELSSLSFLCFLTLSSSSLSGDLKTFLARCTGALFSSSSDFSFSCWSSISSLLLLRSALELERLAWMARLSDLSPPAISLLPAVGPVWD